MSSDQNCFPNATFYQCFQIKNTNTTIGHTLGPKGWQPFWCQGLKIKINFFEGHNSMFLILLKKIFIFREEKKNSAPPLDLKYIL